MSCSLLLLLPKVRKCGVSSAVWFSLCPDFFQVSIAPPGRALALVHFHTQGHIPSRQTTHCCSRTTASLRSQCQLFFGLTSCLFFMSTRPVQPRKIAQAWSRSVWMLTSLLGCPSQKSLAAGRSARFPIHPGSHPATRTVKTDS